MSQVKPKNAGASMSQTTHVQLYTIVITERWDVSQAKFILSSKWSYIFCQQNIQNRTENVPILTTIHLITLCVAAGSLFYGDKSKQDLTHLPLVSVNRVGIGSDNGLSRIRRQAII